MGNINAKVDLQREGEVALVTVDNPPVNALKHEVRAGLAEALRRARGDDAARAVVIACAGRTFFAGARQETSMRPSRRTQLQDNDTTSS